MTEMAYSRAASASATGRAEFIRIEPSRGWVPLRLAELWAYRELIYFLAWREIKVRYKQTVLGAAWAIVQPFCTMLIFTIIFGRLVKVPSDGVPYPIFSYAALVPWTFFASGLTRAANSLVGNSHLIKKVYFPRLAIPVSAVLSGLVDFILAFILLIGLMLYYGMVPPLNIIWFPLFLALAVTTALGVSLWLSALNVMFRDVGYATTFLVQLWFYATPIAYPTSMLSPSWQVLYSINPMVGVIEGFRWALLGTPITLGPIAAASSLAALFVLVSGLYYFRRFEKNFADVV